MILHDISPRPWRADEAFVLAVFVEIALVLAVRVML